MIFKIRTSKKTTQIFQEIGASEQLQPFILSKLAIALSIKNQNPLTDSDFRRDNNGLELNRQTITGEYDILFKCLIEMKEHRHIEDDEYFKNYVKAHLDRGASYLQNEHKYGSDFFVQLLKTENSI